MAPAWSPGGPPSRWSARPWREPWRAGLGQEPPAGRSGPVRAPSPEERGWPWRAAEGPPSLPAPMLPPGPLAPGRVAVLGHGPFPVSLLLAQAVLAPEGGGRAVVVDGGGRFDPHALARWACELGAPPRRVLESVLVARAFTCHQLAALVEERLPLELASGGARLVAVLALTRTFADVPPREGVPLLRRTLEALSRAVRASGARCLVTLDRAPETYLERLARERAAASGAA